MSRLAIAALGLGVALAGLLTGCDGGGGEPTPPAAASPIEIEPRAVGGAEHVVQLPTGQVSLRVDPDLGALDADEVIARERRPLAAGQRRVGVAWEIAPGAGVPGWLTQALAGRDQLAAPVPDGAVVVDGRRFPLGPLTGGPALAVDVPADGQVSVDIVFDGQTQTLDVAGGELSSGTAAALYDLPDQEPAADDCSRDWRATATPAAPPRLAEAVAGLRPRVCSWTRLDLPYVADVGWAEPDRPWLLLTTATRLGDLETAVSRYRVAEQHDATTVGDAEPVLRLLDAGNDGAWSAIAVYPWSAEPPELARRIDYARASGPGPDRLTVTAGTTLRTD